MHAVLRPFVSHLFQHTENLAEVQILLIRHDVQALIEMISIMAIDGRRKIAGGIERRAVGAEDDAGGHIVLAQINDRCTLGDGQQVLFLQFVDNTIHLVVIERLARIGVERDAQQLIDALGIAQSQRLEPIEDAQGFLVAILNLLEPRTALIVQRGIFLGLLVELDVQANQFVHAALFHLFLVAPELIGADHLAKLRSPVAQMVDTDGLISEEIIDAAQAVTNHRGGQMPDMETFGDIDRGIVKTNRLAIAHIGRAIVFSRLEHAFKRFRREIDAVEEEVHIAVDGFCPRNVLMRPLFDHGRGDFRRCHPQCFRQPEHRQRVVAHFRVRRHGKQTADFLRRRQTLRVLPCVGQALRHQPGEFRFHIHKAHNSLYAMLRFPTAIIPYFRPRRKGSSQSSNGT